MPLQRVCAATKSRGCRAERLQPNLATYEQFRLLQDSDVVALRHFGFRSSVDDDFAQKNSGGQISPNLFAVVRRCS